MNEKYGKPGRLGDVVGLIQVLAFDEHTHRSENGLRKEFGEKSDVVANPNSASDWIDVAKEHPEFFRVGAIEKTDKNWRVGNKISLFARHVLEKDNNERRPPLKEEYVQTLIKIALELHSEYSGQQFAKELSEKANVLQKNLAVKANDLQRTLAEKSIETQKQIVSKSSIATIIAAIVSGIVGVILALLLNKVSGNIAQLFQ